ncbi:DUF423 domain-containing protein [Acidomonas methanolica]|uniref:DUF423 domain-containing protein n=1 Tax=Acidomonas methanolica NBRC 104435 TaxID=1231351 RepID=A0A023D308_ACIMT|nr:DUF423 domain-containing protein [Acidomonas methanolica]MBU2654739.1 DUF423 domain-containing protein [Acidomonas methanolica]TCS26405.1 uncharacterized membrane protein YgdD (TMEM256/DUF423 family) [Acidomonas methanolica]GAJ28522.1 hypothetical protein Amme_030_022 [Acidomonas methanolica NBRC 104435]GBQ50536.1 hypothetical protein AA0498_1239 [Acidomonas methanolica]GEK99762.1 hypothetical protein AME01nite_22610 [Acidomonas methanolica NBRC 104435]
MSAPCPSAPPSPPPSHGPFATWRRVSLAFAGLSGATAVAMAALAAHLPDRMLAPNGREMMGRAVEMQIWHSLVLLVLAFAGRNVFRWVAPGFALGQVLFCVPVYLLALKGPAIGFIAPWGGSVLILSWLGMAMLAVRRSI